MLIYIYYARVDYIHKYIYMRLCDCYYVPKRVSICEHVMLYKDVSVD